MARAEIPQQGQELVFLVDLRRVVGGPVGLLVGLLRPREGRQERFVRFGLPFARRALAAHNNADGPDVLAVGVVLLVVGAGAEQRVQRDAVALDGVEREDEPAVALTDYAATVD